MYAVSQSFLDAVIAGKRRIHGKVLIDWTDTFIDQSIEVSVNEGDNISYPQQVADNIKVPSKKWASLDGSWILDGTYSLAPDEENPKYQMGWWGTSIAGVGGLFSNPYPTLIITFFSRPVRKLEVIGDSLRQEWPVDFVINLYDESTIVHSESIIGNDQIEWVKDISDLQILSVTKIELQIKKWSHEGKQVKILEFFTSIQEEYLADDIMFISLLEEREVANGSLPIGNISSNEVDIKLSNIDRIFDAENSTSRLYQLIKKNRRIKPFLGIELHDKSVEWVPLGVFYSGDWNVPETEIWASTSGRDRLELLRGTTFSISQVLQNISLYDLAVMILEHAGLKESEYWIDDELKDDVIPWSYFNPVRHREALRKIAEACLGQVYADREGVIRIEGASFIESRTTEAYVITRDNYINRSRPTNSSQIANYIVVNTQPLKPTEIQEVYRSNEPVLVGAGDTKSITIFYSDKPVIEATVSLEETTNIIITDVSYYSWGANVSLTNQGITEESCIIVANGKILKIQGSERITESDPESIIDNGRLEFELPANHLIQTEEISRKIASKLLSSFKDPRRDLSLDWRGNPALLLADEIEVEERYGNSKFYVTRQNIEYDGGLTAQTEGRKI